MKKQVSRILTKVFIFALAAMLCLQTAVIPSFAADSDSTVPAEYAPTYKYMSKDNAPTLYGTTAIKVPVGTEIDYKHDARFRVFAKDNEDFDLTNQIQAVVSDEINPNEPGHYEITYTVFDKDGNSDSVTVPVDIEEGRTEVWLQKTMYSLPSVDHLNNTGHTRGNNMDRQIIGIFLDVDESGDPGAFQMRKISGKGNLTVPLQNNNGYCESTATVSGQYDPATDEGWQTIKNTGSTTQAHDGTLASVPTVKSLYKETVPVVYEVKYNADDERIQPLHYYHEGDGFEYETQFLAEWEADTDSFAVVDGVSMMALMPYIDRVHVYDKSQRAFESFDLMFDFWTKVLDIYDGLIGISYTPDYYWNQAVKTKYFVRANKHGAGAAYYNSGDCIGTNRTDMFSALCPWWGTLHEYGHGYQGNVGNSSYGMPITEVAVNIFSYYIQRLSGLYPSKTENWLGDIDTKEDSWNAKRKAGIQFVDSVIGSDTTLYALLNMLNATGDYMNAYASLNQYYREVYFTTGVKMKNQDAWILAMAKNYGINLTPYIESWGITVSDYVKDEMMLSGVEAVYFMSDMVADPALSAELKKELGTVGDYGLVKTSSLAEKGLTGTVKITFNISDFENIKNKYLYIYNGSSEIAKVQVTTPELTLELPVGIYKVAPPRGNISLEYDRFYMTVVNNAETPYEITYKDIETVSEGNDIRIQSRGYWEPTSDSYLPFVIETQGNSLIITYRGTRTRSYSVNASTLFSKISILNADGEEIYSKSVNGGGATWVGVSQEVNNIITGLGYKLKIYYRGDKTDMTITAKLTGEDLSDDYRIKDTVNHEITYVFTEYGLVTEDMAQDEAKLYEMYKNRVNSYIDLFSEENDINNPFTNPKDLDKISELITLFTPEDKAEYAGIFTQGSAPVITFTEESYTYEVNTFDLEKFKENITITDVEEKIIDVNSNEVKITSFVDPAAEGTYSIQVEVTDKEGNVTIAMVSIIIVDSSKGEEPENPGSEEPSNPGSEEPSNPGSSNSENKECAYCGKVHSNGVLDTIMGLFHRILYFFSHLFG
ncbi:MAG: M60 family metallopeptidase [Oscillospiraceae bacterium]|nr:M60 family metallopeptidase [Oscillospiraceae bacterium]